MQWQRDGVTQTKRTSESDLKSGTCRNLGFLFYTRVVVMAQILVARMLRPVWHWWNLMSFPTCSFPLLFLAGNSTQVP